MSSPVHKEHDIQEYVDGRLDGRRREEFLAYLDANPELADYVDGLKKQNESLRRLGAEVLEEPVPGRLSAIVCPKADAKRRPSRQRNRFRFMEAAAAALIFICGGIGGWWVHGAMNPVPSQVQLVLENASRAYGLYGSGNGSPGGFSPERSKELEEWIEKLFGRPIPYPDLSADGYQFAGGNILPDVTGQTVFFLFSRSEGGTVSVVAWATKNEPSQTLTVSELGKTAARYWFSDGLGYAVLGDHADEGLGKVSESIFKFYGEIGEQG